MIVNDNLFIYNIVALDALIITILLYNRSNYSKNPRMQTRIIDPLVVFE